jgi:hypothetical protein
MVSFTLWLLYPWGKIPPLPSTHWMRMKNNLTQKITLHIVFNHWGLDRLCNLCVMSAVAGIEMAARN